MTLDGFLTFLALIVAFYALVPPETRLRARVGLSLQLLAAAVAFILVLYLEFFALFGASCPQALGKLCERVTFAPGGVISPQDAAFFIVLAWMAAAFAIHRLVRPGAEALPALARIVDELAYERRYAELLKVTEPFLPLIARASWRRLTRQLLHDRLVKWRDGRKSIVGLLGKDHQPEPGKLRAVMQRQLGRLGPIIPAQRQAEQAAKDIARMLYNSEPLRVFMVEERPYFAIALLTVDPWGGLDFTHAFFGDLIRTPGSALYQELRQTQELTWGGGFKIPQSNRLLHFLLADAEVAIKHSVWKPIGDYMLECVRKDSSNAYLERLNRPVMDDFDDARWRDPVWTSMWFFDVMVRAAAFQGVTNHMWLMYLRTLITRLVENYNPSHPDVDQDDEFPTLGARYIYEAVDMMGAWVKLAADVPEGSRNAAVPAPGSDRCETIPTAAAESLATAIAVIAHPHNELGDTLAVYFHEMVMRDLKDLANKPTGKDIRAFLVALLGKGGARDRYPELKSRLRHLFTGADERLQIDVEDYGTSLGR